MSRGSSMIKDRLVHECHDDEPITLADACNLYPQARLSVSTLRAEAAGRRLVIFRLGRRDYTTPRDMRELVRRCREEDYRRDCISIEQEANGSSETERVSSARAALSATVTALRQGLPRISGKSTPRNEDGRR
jgi:hypothetical protein